MMDTQRSTVIPVFEEGLFAGEFSFSQFGLQTALFFRSQKITFVFCSATLISRGKEILPILEATNSL